MIHLALFILHLPLGIINIVILHLINTVGRLPCNVILHLNHCLVAVIVFCHPNIVDPVILAHCPVTLVTPPPHLVVIIAHRIAVFTRPLPPVTMVTPLPLLVAVVAPSPHPDAVVTVLHITVVAHPINVVVHLPHPVTVVTLPPHPVAVVTPLSLNHLGHSSRSLKHHGRSSPSSSDHGCSSPSSSHPGCFTSQHRHCHSRSSSAHRSSSSGRCSFGSQRHCYSSSIRHCRHRQDSLSPDEPLHSSLSYCRNPSSDYSFSPPFKTCIIKSASHHCRSSSYPKHQTSSPHELHMLAAHNGSLSTLLIAPLKEVTKKPPQKKSCG